jgi:hypothetical protein
LGWIFAVSPCLETSDSSPSTKVTLPKNCPAGNVTGIT